MRVKPAFTHSMRPLASVMMTALCVRLATSESLRASAFALAQVARYFGRQRARAAARVVERTQQDSTAAR
jgi:hypothetical protein